MKRLFLLMFCIALSYLGYSQNSAQAILAKTEAAQRVQHYLNLIPVGQESEYGFANRNDFHKVTIGEPYQTYFVEKVGSNLRLLVTQQYRVPLLVNGKSVALLTVAIKNGKAEAADFGATKLAAKLQEFEAAHKAELKDRVIIRNTYVATDFLMLNLSAVTNTIDGKLLLNTTTSAALYPVNAGQFAAVKPADVVSQTLVAPVR